MCLASAQFAKAETKGVEVKLNIYYIFLAEGV